MFFETGMDGISPHGIFYHDIIISEPQCNIIMIVNMYTTQKFGGKICIFYKYNIFSKGVLIDQMLIMLYFK